MDFSRIVLRTYMAAVEHMSVYKPFSFESTALYVYKYYPKIVT